MTLESLHTIGDAIRMAAERHHDRPLLALPACDRRDYLRDGVEWSYGHLFLAFSQKIEINHSHRLEQTLASTKCTRLHVLNYN